MASELEPDEKLIFVKIFAYFLLVESKWTITGKYRIALQYISPAVTFCHLYLPVMVHFEYNNKKQAKIFPKINFSAGSNSEAIECKTLKLTVD